MEAENRAAGGVGDSGADELDRALARAVLCRLLSVGFDVPRRALLDLLAQTDALQRAATLIDAEPSGDALQEAICQLGRCAKTPLAELVARYERIFGHALRGLVCPYGAEYGRREVFQQSQELASLLGTYRAFGFEVSRGSKERPDHIACQLEFLELLSLKEAYAREQSDVEMLAVTRSAMAGFFEEYLARFGRAFAYQLIAVDGSGYLGALGQILDALLVTECTALGVPFGPELLDLCAEEDEVPMACGDGCGGPVGEPGLVRIGARTKDPGSAA
jgi:TorA maturation chaperone TorD